MRAGLLFVAVMIAGCGAHHASGPAWPKRADREPDGGESLAPRQAATSVATADATGDGDDDVKVVATPAATPAATAAATPTVAPTITAPEETITVEDIVIEVDD